MTDDDVRAALRRWRAYRAGPAGPIYPPELYAGWPHFFVNPQSDAATLADALLAWEDRFGGEFPPGFFTAPTPKPTTEESR